MPAPISISIRSEIHTLIPPHTASAVLAMPASRPSPSSRPANGHRSSSTNAAIIVGVIIGVLGFGSLVLFVWDRRRRYGVKQGRVVKSSAGRATLSERRACEKDPGLEIGVVHDALPVYQKELTADKNRVLGG